MKKKIIVLMGGPSSEHKVSLASGKNVIEALDPQKYLARPVIIPKSPPTPLWKSGAWGDLLNQTRADVAFIALHGKYGEDGTIQAILETLKIPYTGSGALASALGMDKPRASAVFKAAGFDVPEFTTLTKYDLALSNLMRPGRVRSYASGPHKYPVVVKPANHGSSVGISIVKNASELKNGIREAFRYSDRVIIQKFIKGREITCGVLEDQKGKLIPLPPIEIRPKKGAFYDYRSKYDDGGSEHLIPPPRLSKKIIKTIQDAACRAHEVIGCSGMSRSDFILGEDGKLYILEINTIPGMTSTSLLPEAAQKAGISFPKLLDLLIENALKRRIL